MSNYAEYREWLVSMVVAMGEEIGLPEEDQVLIILQLNTPEKICQFNDWIRTKLINKELVATPAEVMNMTAKIGRLECNE